MNSISATWYVQHGVILINFGFLASCLSKHEQNYFYLRFYQPWLQPCLHLILKCVLGNWITTLNTRVNGHQNRLWLDCLNYNIYFAIAHFNLLSTYLQLVTLGLLWNKNWAAIFPKQCIFTISRVAQIKKNLKEKKGSNTTNYPCLAHSNLS